MIKYIDFRRIKGQILIDIIKPLNIISAEIIQHNTESINSDLNDIRGIPICKINKSKLFWDISACESKLIVEDNGKLYVHQMMLNIHAKVLELK